MLVSYASFLSYSQSLYAHN
uniref:Uncharacterized protein n=1 Tax=Arundo donax TaxID=35708 RepID=A0A0A9APE4_ARUDO